MKRSKFSLSNYKLLTMNMGVLTPVNWFEVLPGDSIQQATSALIRVSPLLAPLMHPVRVRLHHWYVPNRLIWDDFEDFITGGEDGTDNTTHPYIALSSVTEGQLLDYLGIQPDTYSPAFNVNALPVRAYQLIFNEFYRDQQLSGNAALVTTSGADATTSNDLQRVSWEKDYFTTARTDEALGDTVTIPLAGNASVTHTGDKTPLFDIGTDDGYLQDNGSGLVAHTSTDQTSDPLLWKDPKLVADLSSVSGVTINDLRLALALQRYQEARNQYGARYVEYLRYLGIRSSDARLNNPEYLGGGRNVIQFSEVLATDGSNTGTMKGHGIGAMRTNRYRRFFEEHGICMTLMSVIPKAIYQSAVDRAWLREVKEDYFQKELQFIGEQEITNREAQADHSTPAGVFGYQNRYDEYRHKASSVASDFRDSLDHWHMARQYSGDIALNSSWVKATPTNRVYASATYDQLYVMANNSIQARRMLSRVARAKTF